MENFRLVYEQARNYALSNVKPEAICSSTNKLRGYKVDLESDSLTLVTHCTIGETQSIVTAANTRKQQNLPPRIRLRNVGAGDPTQCSGIEFLAITGNVRPPTAGTLPCTIEIYHVDDSDSLVREITITQDGRISFNDTP